MAEITLRLKNFRVLDGLEWSPRGVNLLAGANGSGKSTFTDALLFLRLFFQRGCEAALRQIKPRFVRSVGVDKDEPVEVDLTAKDVRWRILLPMNNAGLISSYYGEEVFVGGEAKLRAGLYQESWRLGGEDLPRDEVRCCAKVALDRGDSPYLTPLADYVKSVQTFPRYFLNKVKDPPPADDGFSARLSWNGENLWAVLRAWKGAAHRYEHRFEWVMEQAKRAFPDLIQDVEFDNGHVALYRPGSVVGLPPERAPDGLLTGLLHLTAIAGMPSGGLIAFDEIEGQLHPHAIRSILRALRERAEEKDLTAVVTTHSPVVMNEFLDEPEQVFVLQSNGANSLVPLTALHTEEWLAQRKLGSLYEDLAFASPLSPSSS